MRNGDARDEAAAAPSGAILITGITGFLGEHVATSCRHQLPDAPLLGLARQAPGPSDTGPLPAVEILHGDVTNDDGWVDAAAARPLRAIVHTAGVVWHSRRSHPSLDEVNVGGTLRLVRLAARTGARLIFVSSSGTVGCTADQTSTPQEDAPFSQEVMRWPYYASKIRAERAARALADELGADLVIVRPPVLLGPGDRRVRSTGHVARFLRRKLPFLLPGGIHFVDVRDVSLALVRLITHPRPQPIYHFPGVATSLVGFFAACARLSGIAAPRVVLPARVALGLSWIAAGITRAFGRRPGWLLPDPVVVEMASRHWGLSSRHVAADLGFVARSGDETLADTIDWIRTNVLDRSSRGGHAD